MLDLYRHDNSIDDAPTPSALLSTLPHLIAIDGPPGSGKTTFADCITYQLKDRGVQYEIVSTDDDVLPRHSRKDLEVVEYHPGELAKEAVLAHFNARFSNGTSFSAPVYSSKTGEHSDQKSFNIPNQKGVLLVEGLRSIEYVLEVLGPRVNTLDQILLVLMDSAFEQSEVRRLHRDTTQKGLSPEEVATRILTQRSTLLNYFIYLRKALRI